MTARRLYLSSNDDSIFAVVSAEDYEWASQWRWSFTWDRHRAKKYATRCTRTAESGGRHFKLYLHKQILIERMQIEPPTLKHTIGDHENGNSLDCRRDNLRWFTPSQNRLTAGLRPANDNAYQEAA